MFKKPIKVGSHNPVSSKNRKKLKKSLSKCFPTDAIDQLFIRSQELSLTKLQGSKVCIYSDDEDPLFVDSTSKKDFFPTSNISFQTTIFSKKTILINSFSLLYQQLS